MKLGIGTAQFGADYGISNTAGKTPAEEVAAVLELAYGSGIRILDTSPLYGDSEAVLGKLLPAQHEFRIVTKTTKFARNLITAADAVALEDTFVRSLERLRQPAIYALLVHQLDDLLSDNGNLLIDRILSLKQRGLVNKVGLSLSRFTVEEVERVLAVYPIDLIQVPLNVVDQRLLASGCLRKLKSTGIEVHARSVFLQGLLLMPPAALPAWFDGVKPRLIDYHDEIARRGLAPAQAALDFVLGLDDVDAVICGINDSAQLRELIGYANLANKVRQAIDFGKFSIADEKILNPTNWRLHAA